MPSSQRNLTAISLSTNVTIIVLTTTALFRGFIGIVFYNWQHHTLHEDLVKQVGQISDQAARTLIVSPDDIQQVGQIVHNITLIPAVYRVAENGENGQSLYSKTLGRTDGSVPTVKAQFREIGKVDLLLGAVEVELKTEIVEKTLPDYLIITLASTLALTCIQALGLYYPLGKEMCCRLGDRFRYLSATFAL